jgi:hypothetical protein
MSRLTLDPSIKLILISLLVSIALVLITAVIFNWALIKTSLRLGSTPNTEVVREFVYCEAFATGNTPVQAETKMAALGVSFSKNQDMKDSVDYREFSPDILRAAKRVEVSLNSGKVFAKDEIYEEGSDVQRIRISCDGNRRLER